MDVMEHYGGTRNEAGWNTLEQKGKGREQWELEGGKGATGRKEGNVMCNW